MKNSILIALAMVLFAGTVTANTMNTENAYTVSDNDIVLSIDLGDITNATAEELTAKINDFINENLSDLDDELTCKVTATGTIGVGIASIEISVEVSGPCSEIRNGGQEIANQILQDIKDALR
ncbi:hypothetical protein [Aquimarina sp. LLG6339-5]|uniref:hypothetical protein n=1 Tax=Aquimarina sp. LLG6339-5 TaxID=3160830 RepID=UPI0038681D79